MKIDKILEFAEKESLELSKDIEQIFTVLWKIESLPDQLVGVIEIGEEREHAAPIALASGVAAFCLCQLFFAFAVKILRINGFQEKAIHELLSIVDDLEEKDKG